MRHRSTMLAGTGVLAAAAIGVFASAGIGGGSVEPASSIDVTRGSAETVEPSELERVSPERLGVRAKASKKSAKVNWYISAERFTVPPGTADLREILCPGKQQPATGGVLAPSPGLAITNSSQMNPDGPTQPGAWYQEVTNFTAVPLGWQVHLTCVGK
jgi:hypothetical protein